jgi:SLT domain-containing protein
MAFNAGGIEYTIDVDTHEMIDAERRVDKFSREATKDFDKVDRASDRLGGGIKKLATSIRVGLVGGALKTAITALGAATASVVTMTVAAGKAERETANLARQARLTSQEFKALSFATNQYGVNAEQIADISKDIADKIGEFATAGTGAFQDYVDVMKLSKSEAMEVAQEFQHLSGRDVLLEMVKNMEAAGATASQMTFALESLGNDASKLTPLLVDNGKALKALEGDFNNITKSMELTVEQQKSLAEVSVAWDLLTKAISAAAALIASGAGPIIIDFLKEAAKFSRDAALALDNVFSKFKETEDIDSIKFLNRELMITNEQIKTLQEGLASGELGFEGIASSPEEMQAAREQLFGLKLEAEDIKKRIKELEKQEAEAGGDATGRSAADQFLDSLIGGVDNALDKKFKPVSKRAIKRMTKMLADDISVGAGNVEDLAKSMSDLVEDAVDEAADQVDKNKKFADIAQKAVVDSLVGEERLRTQMKAELEALREHFEETTGMTDEFRTAQLAIEAEYVRKIDEFRKKNAESAERAAKRVKDAKDREVAAQERRNEVFAKFAQKAIMQDPELDPMERLKLEQESEIEALEDHFENVTGMNEEFEAAKTAILARHTKERDDLRKQESRAALISVTEIVGRSSQLFAELADVAEESKGKQSGVYKAMFALSKGFAIAQAGINLSLAISNAMASLPYPANLGAMASVASSGISLVGAIQDVKFGGGRRNGGTVSSGKMFEINETGSPEVFSAGGRDFLMATQNAQVTPMERFGNGGKMGGQGITINNFGNDKVEARETDNGVIIEIARDEARKAATAAYDRVATDFASNKGKVFTAAVQHTNMTGRAGRGR